MNGTLGWFDIELLKEICRDYFHNRGYLVEVDVPLIGDLRWRPSLIAKRGSELIAMEVRTTEDLPDYLIKIFEEAKSKASNANIYLCIPKEAKVSKRTFFETAKLGMGIYEINGTTLRLVYSPDLESGKSLEEETGLRVKEFVISPETPYGNIRALRTILRNCKNYIFWLEKHFSKNGIERLYEELVEGNLSNIRNIKILSGPANVTAKFKEDFKRFKKECKKNGIEAKCKIICDRKVLDELHHRFLLTDGSTYSLPPVNSIEMGQWSSLIETQVKFPFDRYWKKGKDIEKNWTEIFDIGEKIRSKK